MRAVLHTYRVSAPRRRRFPLDMLRHDQAWPMTTEDANLIAASQDRDSRDLLPGTRRTIALTGTTPPTEGRWDSFGWRVEEYPS